MGNKYKSNIKVHGIVLETITAYSSFVLSSYRYQSVLCRWLWFRFFQWRPFDAYIVLQIQPALFKP